MMGSKAQGRGLWHPAVCCGDERVKKMLSGPHCTIFPQQWPGAMPGGCTQSISSPCLLILRVTLLAHSLSTVLSSVGTTEILGCRGTMTQASECMIKGWLWNQTQPKLCSPGGGCDLGKELGLSVPQRPHL